jgi:hypothetical protein
MAAVSSLLQASPHATIWRRALPKALRQIAKLLAAQTQVPPLMRTEDWIESEATSRRPVYLTAALESWPDG